MTHALLPTGLKSAKQFCVQCQREMTGRSVGLSVRHRPGVGGSSGRCPFPTISTPLSILRHLGLRIVLLSEAAGPKDTVSLGAVA